MEHELLKRRVVVTGLGLVTPLGNRVEATWAGLMAGRSGNWPAIATRPRPLLYGCNVGAAASQPQNLWRPRQITLP